MAGSLRAEGISAMTAPRRSDANFQIDAGDCSPLVSALVHYAGQPHRADPDPLRAHDLVKTIACSVGLPPTELVRQRSPTRFHRARPLDEQDPGYGSKYGD